MTKTSSLHEIAIRAPSATRGAVIDAGSHRRTDVNNLMADMSVVIGR